MGPCGSARCWEPNNSTRKGSFPRTYFPAGRRGRQGFLIQNCYLAGKDWMILEGGVIEFPLDILNRDIHGPSMPSSPRISNQKSGKLKPKLFVIRTNTSNLTYRPLHLCFRCGKTQESRLCSRTSIVLRAGGSPRRMEFIKCFD